VNGTIDQTNNRFNRFW